MHKLNIMILESKIEKVCRDKENELIDKYFEHDVKTAPDMESDPILGIYTKDLPHKIEAEFCEFLCGLWKEYSDKPLVLEEQKLRWLMTEDNREEVDVAYKDARRITLWERITGSNSEDIARYRAILRDYTKDILLVMRTDFLEEITGHHINCKYRYE